MAAITEAPKLRKMRDDAIRARNGGAPPGSAAHHHKKASNASTDGNRDVVLVKGMESFAQSSQKGLTMGTGRAKESSDSTVVSPSPPAITLGAMRNIKAAQIRFDNCASNASSGELTTSFTLPLVMGIETVGDLKEAAITRLGGRQLLKRGPEVDRGFFALKWADEAPGRSARIPDETSLADLDIPGSGPVVKLILVEYDEHPAGPVARSKVTLFFLLFFLSPLSRVIFWRGQSGEN